MSSTRYFFLGLQSIHQINIFRKTSFPMKIPLIFTLIVVASLSLKWQIFVDSVNFIAHTCNIKNNQIYHYLMLKDSKVTSVVNFIPSKFWSLSQRVSKVVLHTGLNVWRESSVDSQFVTNTLSVRYKQDHKVTNKIYFMDQFNFLCNFYESMCPIPIQNHVHS